MKNYNNISLCEHELHASMLVLHLYCAVHIERFKNVLIVRCFDCSCFKTTRIPVHVLGNFTVLLAKAMLTLAASLPQRHTCLQRCKTSGVREMLKVHSNVHQCSNHVAPSHLAHSQHEHETVSKKADDAVS